MVVFPAVDIKGGHCVRLLQGRPEADTQYYEEPLRAARHWLQEGARTLHVVDLDGALSESNQNAGCVRDMLRELPIPVQVGGGLRSLADVTDILEFGAARAVVGTRAVTEPEWTVDLCRRFPGRIVIALDVREGEVAVKGWREGAGVRAEELARRFGEGSPAAFLYTDISRDGMLTHPNFEAVEALLGVTDVPVIASGGVSQLEDIQRLGECGADAVIVGKALYENRFTLGEALEVARGFTSRLPRQPGALRERGQHSA